MTADNLRHHRRRSQRDHEPGAPFVAIMLGAKEDMAVLPGLDGMSVHETPVLGMRGSTITASTLLTFPPGATLARHAFHQRLSFLGELRGQFARRHFAAERGCL